MNETIKYYALCDQYEALITKVRQCAPSSVTEKWGVVKFRGVPDFRLNFGRYRVIELAPMARHIGVFMEWRKIFKNPGVYAGDPDFHLFEDAFGYLGVKEDWNYPWNVQSGTDLSDPYVNTFLKSGMRLMVKEIRRAHRGRRIVPEDVSYCGVDCKQCDIFKATVHGDKEALGRAHEVWTKTAQEHWEMQTLDPAILNCRGCRIEGNDIFRGCRYCPMRRCAKQRNLISCGFCSEMTDCERLKELFADETQQCLQEAKKNLQDIARMDNKAIDGGNGGR